MNTHNPPANPPANPKPAPLPPMRGKTGNANIDDAVIVTRHKGTVEWLRRKGITGTVVSHASLSDVKDRVVYGVLPIYLAAHTIRFYTLDLQGMSYSKRGMLRAEDMSADELEARGARLRCYIVRACDSYGRARVTVTGRSSP